MCGIVGIVGKIASKERAEELLSEQVYRGPDHQEVFVIPQKVALGHNRLSIIDLSATANQPMKSSCERYTIIFNGEVYNYKELKFELADYDYKTHSDTEVVLAAYIKWGQKCLDRFIGMFSFAIWDSHNDELFAARDRFGVKPFYYANFEDSVVFASEIKTIHAAGFPAKASKEVWASFLVHASYGQPNETFWEGIHQLPGGHFLRIKNGELVFTKWYNFEEEIAKQKVYASFDELKVAYTSLLKDAIGLRFRADVPVGFNLSGGLDSSTLLAMVDQVESAHNIEAFTFYTDDERYDELPWVQKLLANTSHPLNKVLLSAVDIPTLHENLQKIQAEPYGGIPTIAYSQLFKEARQKGIIVLLDGQGMDEAWAGYDYYHKAGKSVVQGSTDRATRPECLTEEFAAIAQKPNYPQPFDDDVKNLQYRDLFYTKIPRALRFNDRVSMLYSTELREPFLDHRLVEMAFAQPTHLKIKDGLTKAVLREIVKDLLPATLSMAPKRALQTPQREWLAVELKSWVESELQKLQNIDWINYAEVQEQWKNFLSGKSDNSFYIWQWISLSGLAFKD